MNESEKVIKAVSNLVKELEENFELNNSDSLIQHSIRNRFEDLGYQISIDILPLEKLKGRLIKK